ncbi:MAG: type II secretion system F family protein [Legionella sp.]|nr:type II secretion system F family protein [Legionella sp.]
MIKKNDALDTFYYEAKNQSGQEMSGSIQAKRALSARGTLRAKGLISIKIYKKRLVFNKRKKGISSGDIALFSRHIATLIQSGVSLVQSINIITEGQQHTEFKKVLRTIQFNLQSGHTLAQTLREHPNCFDEMYCNMIDTGELSGTLDIILEHLAAYKEKIEQIKKKMKRAITYPIAVLIIAILVTIGLLVFIVPQFESIFANFGAELPLLTRVVISTSQTLKSRWYVIVGGLSSFWFGFIYMKQTNPQFIRFIDTALLRIPLIGALLGKEATARFTRTLSMTYKAGLPMVDALQSVAGVTGNRVYAQATYDIRERIIIGEQLNKAISATNLFPEMVSQIIAIGEETGRLDKMLNKIADIYEEDVTNTVDSLGNLLEPLIMSLLGILIGGLIIAMYLPIFKLGSII